MNKYRKIILGVVLVGLLFMAGFAYKVYTTFLSPNTNFESETYEVFIPSDADYNKAFLIFADAVEDRDALHQTAVRKKYHENVKAGRFLIKKGSSNNDIINTLRSGNTPVKVRFNNQERIEDLAGRLAAQVEPDSLSLLKAFTDSTFLNEAGVSREEALTLFLPNTYDSYWNTTATSLRDKLYSYHQQYWNENRRSLASKQRLTPSQAYILASIVHKETAMKDERARVAGVYLNRLKKNIKLDADPTVIYAKKKKDGDFNQVIKQVLYKHLEIDSEYNTYKNAGLPPGPIVTPDIDAINAVLQPENHDYFYFVADVQNFGYHKFAKTLTQHNINAAAYRRWIKRNNK